MKTVIRKFLLAAAVITIFCFAASSLSTVKADGNIEESVYVEESYRIDISGKEIFLPVPDIPENWAYDITLKKGETVLGEKITKYLFQETGDYTLVYRLYVDRKLTDVIEKTAILSVYEKESEKDKEAVGGGCGCSGNIEGDIPIVIVLMGTALVALMKIKKTIRNNRR